MSAVRRESRPQLEATAGQVKNANDEFVHEERPKRGPTRPARTRKSFSSMRHATSATCSAVGGGRTSVAAALLLTP